VQAGNHRWRMVERISELGRW